MIYQFPYARWPTPRTYLSQWFHDDIIVITDGDLNCPDFDHVLSQQPPARPVLDLSHNPITFSNVDRYIDPTLSGDFSFFYNPKEGVIFFPLFLWMFSLRTNLWWPPLVFDAGNSKTQKAMCFNSTDIWHRTELFRSLEPVRDQIVYSFGSNRIDSPDDLSAKMGVQSEPYAKCAVNIVTETRVDVPFCGEKTAKPFVARQIPIIVGSAGVNQFLSDVGLDMFDDLIPWRSWDHMQDDHARLNCIASFLLEWIAKEDIVGVYHRVKDRVEKNKQYFHSERFRQRLMEQMDQLAHSSI